MAAGAPRGAPGAALHLILLALGCGPPEPTYATFSTEVMRTRLEVVLPESPEAPAHAEAVFDVFRGVEATANEWKAGSPLAEVNRRAGEPVAVPSDVSALLARSLELAALSDGAFDPTWAALWGLWDFDDPKLPSEAEVAERVARVGWRRVTLDGDSVTLEPGTVLGLGAVAKGWALDHAGAELRRRGVTSFSLNVGQVLVGGKKGDRPWRVGIRDPRGTSPSDFFAIVELVDASISTSGDYERFFEQGGVRYHHILDPRTGWPSKGLRSASAIGPDATAVDALTTAMMVLGKDGALALAGRAGVEAVLVDDAGAVHATPGAKVNVVRPPTP